MSAFRVSSAICTRLGGETFASERQCAERGSPDPVQQSIGCKTQVSGDENGGRIAFAYASREELEMLLAKLGVALPEAQSDNQTDVQPALQAEEEIQKTQDVNE